MVADPGQARDIRDVGLEVRHAHDDLGQTRQLGAQLSLPADRIGPHGSDAVRVGVRPEKITLVPAGQDTPAGSNVLRGTVVVAAFLGVSIQYLIRAAGGEELTVIAQNAEGYGPDALGVGRQVQLAWMPQHTFVVAKETSHAG